MRSLRNWFRRQRLNRRIADVEQQLAIVEKTERMKQGPPSSLLGHEFLKLRGRDRRRLETSVRKSSEKLHKRQVRRLEHRVSRLNRTVNNTRRGAKSAVRRNSPRTGR